MAPHRGHSLSLPEHRPASPAQGGSLGPFSPRLSPARAALPLGHQVAPSQGAQESLTGEGLSTCRPSRQHAPPPKVQVGLPPVWQESQLFEPLERRPPRTGRARIRGCAPPPKCGWPSPSSPQVSRALGSDSQVQMKFLPPSALLRGGQAEVGAWWGASSPQHPPRVHGPGPGSISERL